MSWISRAQEQFDQAQDIHKHKLAPKWRPPKNHLFPKLVKCKECGSTMTPTFTNKFRLGRRKRYYYYRCTSTYKRDFSACSIKQISSNRLEGFILENFKRISCDQQYLESLSYTLNQNRSGAREGFEPEHDEPAIQPEDIKEVLRKVIETASTKEVINKGDLMGKHINKIVYSQEAIEIKLCSQGLKSNLPAGKAGDFRAQNGENNTNSLPAYAEASAGRQLPKMPPPFIFRGRLGNHFSR